MKLVRDKIPEIMNTSGKQAITHTANREEYMKMLEAKLGEEVAEYLADNNPNELVDIVEVVYALAQQYGMSQEQLEQNRKEKREERGGFDLHIILET